MEDSDQDAGETGSFGCSSEGGLSGDLWDQHQERLAENFVEITESAGAHPVLVQNLADLRLVQCCAQCCVAVAVTGPVPGVGMQAIRDLKAKGFKVIACEEGTGSWPIKTKCLPLLAGAVQLLDSASADFSRDLRQVIERIVSPRRRSAAKSARLLRPCVAWEWSARVPR